MTPVNQWFGRKQFGWRWNPRSIEDWAVIAVPVAILLLLAR